MAIYKPTWLYIKQHNQTGLKYFGKTTCQNPYTYKGSGTYWSRHLKKHGSDISTIWCHLYISKEELVEEAMSFSLAHDIVNSKNKNGKKIWANERPENGLDGGNIKGANKGQRHSNETKELIRKIRTGTKQSDETKAKRSASLKGRVFTEEHLDKLRKPKPPRSVEHSQHHSLALKGKPWSEARRAAQKSKAKKC